MTRARGAFRWITRHRLTATGSGLSVTACLLIAVVALASSTSASAEVSTIEAQLLAAIRTDLDMSKVGSGVAPAHLSPDQQAALATSLEEQARPAFSRTFTAKALTDRISNHPAWAKEASTGDAPVNLSYQVESFNPGDPIVAGGTATVTGTYVVRFKNGQDMPKGLVTSGGTATQAFTAVLTKVDGCWLVSTYAERQVAETDHPEDHSGWDSLPSPSPTTRRSPPTPLPVKP